MPVIAVNVVKVAFVLALYGFLFYVARAMRGHVVGPPTDPSPTPAPASRRRVSGKEAPPPAPRRVVLLIHTGGGEPLTVRLDGPVVVGRGASADATIDDEYASDRHARFEFDGETIWVEDLGSTNGTRIGESRISERTAIGSGTEVVVGRTKVVVR